MKTLLTTLLIFLFSVSGSLEAQKTSMDSKILEKSTITIDGTSNVHDWTSEVKQINSNIIFNAEAMKADNPFSPVQSLTLTIPVDKIDSGKGGMNRRMHGALKKDDHPNIRFELVSSEVKNGNASDNKFELSVTGDLTIAGVTNKVTIPVTAVQDAGNTYKFSGSYEINMKDYNMDPPTAMLGAVRSGEMVTVNFDIYVSN